MTTIPVRVIVVMVLIIAIAMRFMLDFMSYKMPDNDKAVNQFFMQDNEYISIKNE